MDYRLAIRMAHLGDDIVMYVSQKCALARPRILFGRSVTAILGDRLAMRRDRVDFSVHALMQWLLLKTNGSCSWRLNKTGSKVEAHVARCPVLSLFCTEMGKITCKMIYIKDQDQLCQRSRSKIIFQGMI